MSTRIIHNATSAFSSITLECSTQCSVLVGEIENVLRQARGLDNAPDLDCTFFLNEFANRVQQVRREL